MVSGTVGRVMEVWDHSPVVAKVGKGSGGRGRVMVR